MASQNKLAKLILTVFFALLFVGASAAEVNFVDNRFVWLDSGESVTEVTASCAGNANITSIALSSDSDKANYSLSEIDTDMISQSGLSDGEYEVSYACDDNSTHSSSKYISLEKASISQEKLNYQNTGEGAIGFAGEEMSMSPYTSNYVYQDSFYNSRPVVVEIDTGGEYDAEDISKSDFSFMGGLELDSIYRKIDSSGSVKVYLEPKVPERLKSYFKQDYTLQFSKGDLVLEQQVDAFVHSWEVQKFVSKPGRQLSFDEVKSGNYQYYLKMHHKGEMPQGVSLNDDNFRLTVYERTSSPEGFTVAKEIYKDYNSEKWLSQSNPSGEANYKVGIANMKPLRDMDKGRYVFQLEVHYQEGQEEYAYVVDRTSIDKSAQYSGVVRGSSGGVNTSMLLNFDNKAKQINTGSDGSFSVPVSNDVESMYMKYFYREKASPDTTISIGNPELLDNSDLGKGGSALKYQYWTDPEVGINGLDPANMMAVKFGHPIEGEINSMGISFSSKNLNPEKLRIYECSYWNFAGQECLGEWNETEDFSINYATLTANLNSVNLYETPSERSILMNAYVLGTSSKMTLAEQLDLGETPSRVKYNGVQNVEGVLETQSTGEPIEDARVVFSLVEDQVDGDVIYRWNTTTDSSGVFEAETQLKDVPVGRYNLRVEASKGSYQDFSVVSDDTIEVYYEKGVRLNGFPDPVRVVQGNESDISFEVSNTGQADIEDLEVSVEGLKQSFYTLESSSIDELEESRSLDMALTFPDNYCSLPCGSPPEVTVSVSGTSAGETVQDEFVFRPVFDGNSNDQSNEQNFGSEDEESADDSSSDTDDSRPESSSSPISGVKEMTGDFVEKQGELNIALGLIFIFTMMLALSVKKKKSGGSDRRSLDDGRGGGRPSLQRPPINSGEVHEVEAKEKESDEGDKAENSQEESEDAEEADKDSDESSDGFKCSVCGEEFESESGRDLHEEAVH